MARLGQISAIEMKKPIRGSQPATTPTPRQISQPIQKCERRVRPSNENSSFCQSKL
jgi:hypothetical protein